ncbi:MAG: hypothetical protein LWW99_12110, partial [Deltaproteobacteria bacterium]|nr:hypothetical protein [Deltaproteobacteria bacterium]
SLSCLDYWTCAIKKLLKINHENTKEDIKKMNVQHRTSNVQHRMKNEYPIPTRSAGACAA